MHPARSRLRCVLPAGLLVLASCGTSINLSFRVNRPPTLLTPGSVDLRASGAVTAHVIDEGGVCGPIDQATDADAGQTSAQTFKLPKGSARAFLLQVPIQLGADYATLVAVLTPYRGGGSELVSSRGPGFLYVLAGGAGQALAPGDLVGASGSITVDRRGRSGTVDAMLRRVVAPPEAPRPSSPSASPRLSTATARRQVVADVRLVGEFRCLAHQEQGS